MSFPFPSVTLLTGSLEPVQQVRLRRFLIASGAYVVSLALMSIALMLELTELRGFVQTAGLTVVVNAVFFGLIRSGLNRRLRDPSLTIPQMVCANLVLMQAAYFADGQTRGLYLLMFLVIFLFGAFRLTTRQFVLLSLFALASYSAVIGVLAVNRPAMLDLRLETLNWIVLTTVLPMFGGIAGQVTALRKKLRASHRELAGSIERLQQIATHDELTGLPNRTMFNQHLIYALDRARSAGVRTALMFLDLDRFKNINDVLGHHAGDTVLAEVGRRLREALRSSELIARLGGDEFVILVEDSGHGRLDGVIARVQAAVAGPVDVSGQPYRISTSIGVSIFPDDADDAATLMRNADIAMYRAKDLGRDSIQFYSAQMRGDARERLALENDMRRALERREFVLHYQPKVEASSGRLTGMEALVRWQHPELGLIGPDRFVPLAEETGMIISLGEWVLREACLRNADWRRMGFADLRIAVNLSARQIHDSRLIELVGSALRDASLDPSGLEMEVTESLVMHDPEQASRLLGALRELGVTLAVDDFGTGYSSLSYLKKLPFDHVKIDRSFIRHLPDDAEDAAITRAVIAMAHSLRLKVIAEGVETDAQRRFLIGLGCDELQGYLVSRPLTQDGIVAMLRSLLQDETEGGAPALCAA